MAKKKGFDLAAILGEVRELDTGATLEGREQIEYIDIDLIDEDAGNFYDTKKIEELAANIELVGLQQPLRVRTNPFAEGRVIAVSGHRRRRALKMLVKEGKEQYRYVPCIRGPYVKSDALKRLQLIFGNKDNREKTSADLLRESEEAEAALLELAEEGYEFPGRMRDHVAELCNTSKSKLSRLKVIKDSLIPNYFEQFEAENITDSAAYNLARLPKDMQERLYKINPAPGHAGYVAQVLEKYNEGWRWQPSLTCPDGRSCRHGEAFLRHDLECYSGDMCGGNTCCLTCSKGLSKYVPCERACGKLKKMKKEQRDAVAKKEQKRKEKIQDERKQKMQNFAKRLVAAADAAGVADDVKIEGRHDWLTYRVKDLREFALGNFQASYYSELPEKCEFDFTDSGVAITAKALGCSADYLIGATDSLSGNVPNLGTQPLTWSEGLPSEDGLYAVVLSEDTFTYKDVLPFSADKQAFYWPHSGEVVTDLCVRWIKLPEVDI